MKIEVKSSKVGTVRVGDMKPGTVFQVAAGCMCIVMSPRDNRINWSSGATHDAFVPVFDSFSNWLSGYLPDFVVSADKVWPPDSVTLVLGGGSDD